MFRNAAEGFLQVRVYPAVGPRAQPWLLEDRDGLEGQQAHVPRLRPAIAGMLCPQPPDCLAWHRAADAVTSQCHRGHGPAEGDLRVPAAEAGGSEGMLSGRGGMRGIPLSCGSCRAAFPGLSPLGCPFEAGDWSKAFSCPRGTMDQRAPAAAPIPVRFQQILAR